MKSDSIADPQFHGRGEGIFMKSMNCGCMALLGLVAFVVVVSVIITSKS